MRASAGTVRSASKRMSASAAMMGYCLCGSICQSQSERGLRSGTHQMMAWLRSKSVEGNSCGGTSTASVLGGFAMVGGCAPSSERERGEERIQQRDEERGCDGPPERCLNLRNERRGARGHDGGGDSDGETIDDEVGSQAWRRRAAV
jgi:hypothetical protein